MTHTRALAILGPTASGKTRLALDLASHLPIEIISLDSALVYQDMNIGTAKPSAAEMAQVPHHLIDIISPLTAYSAADFVNDSLRLIQEIHGRQRLPVIVGGTMMYYQALNQGLNALPSADRSIRAQLCQHKAQFGLASLYQRLQQIDPETASRLSAHDSQRIERALEVYLLTGTPMSQLLNRANTTNAVDLYSITLIPNDRQQLHQHIATRFDAMLEQGLLAEVTQLQHQYPQLHADLPSMRAVGYRQVWDYLAGNIDHSHMREQGIIATRQLAKRQLTWLRKISAHARFDPYQSPNLLTKVNQLACQFFEYRP